jgi:predicted O-methyltransferase YrrM
MPTAGKFTLSPRVLTEPFWDVMLSPGEERVTERALLLDRLNGLEALRAQAAYNTGSIAFAAGWCLYSLVRHFRLTRALEVGTFIGKSTVSMASAMDDGGSPGEIFTCDASNRLDLPWTGQTTIRQFPAASSTQMLEQLEGSFDLAFLDGRLQADDLPHMERLLAPEAIIALDDFEGMEKGVANLSRLRSRAMFKTHVLVYPPSRELLRRFGFASYATTAVLIPASRIEIAAQG